MPDIYIISRATVEETVADWLLNPDDTLEEKQALVTAVKVALMTDRLASPEEILPDPDSDDRRGWWGDFEAESIWDGWPIGTKNWLLTRAKITPPQAREGATVFRAEQYTRDALRPFIAKGLCSHIEVFAERVGLERIDVIVVIYRGPIAEIELRFQHLWTEIVGA